MQENREEIEEKIKEAVNVFKNIEQRLEKDIIGQKVLKRRLLTALLTSGHVLLEGCLLYTSPSPRDQRGSRMPSSA